MLDDTWIDEPSGVDFRGRLRERVNREHEVHRPIAERQIGGRLVASLDAPVAWAAGPAGTLTMLDMHAAPDPTEAVALGRVGGWHDPRIDRVLAHLDDRERAVAMAYAEGGDGMTWRLAAAAAGVDPKFATRVQTKLQREGRKLRERLNAAAGTVTR
ncbi:hypothetical protein ACFO1B_29760 [Dactylosporangium siamense]|uniref:hypothetical protein n=1 Tax=Dactylosporangium siamense TaxID=685454 RepID=UPI001944A494|nr:hypothetical protein [Dactylosporangium siamense]